MNRPRGFTLLEVLIATAILGVAVVALMGTQSGALRLSGVHDDQSLAAQFAQHLFAEAVITPYADLGADSGEGEGVYVRYSWSRTVQPTATDRLSRVTIVVSDLEGAEVLTLESLVTPREVDL